MQEPVTRRRQRQYAARPIRDTVPITARNCATTDLSQIKVGMLISAQYGSNTAAGNAYGHVGIYIGDGKVMDSIYSGLRTISLSDWVSQNGRGWVVCGYPWDWR